MMLHVMHAVILMEQIVKVLEVIDEAALLRTPLYFESTATVEARAHISRSLVMMTAVQVLVLLLLLMMVIVSGVMLVVATVGTMVMRLLVVSVISSPSVRPQG